MPLVCIPHRWPVETTGPCPACDEIDKLTRRADLEMRDQIRAVLKLDLTLHQLFVLASTGSVPCRVALLTKIPRDRMYEVFLCCQHGVMGCAALSAGHTEHVFPE